MRPFRRFQRPLALVSGLASAALLGACGGDGGAGASDVAAGADTASGDGVGGADTAGVGEDTAGGGACVPSATFEALGPILAGGKVSPTGRGEHAQVFDPCNQRVVLFGGNDLAPTACADSGPARFQDDTWAYSLEHANWARLTTSTAPSPRGRHAMAYDPNRQRIYLFGGRFRPEGGSGLYTLLGDLWALDLATDTWSEIADGGAVPSARTNTAMAFDAARDRLYLFGGNTSPDGLAFAPQNDLYVFDPAEAKWRLLNPPTDPSPRLFHALTLDPATGRLYAFSGGGADAFFGVFFNDLWMFDPDAEAWSAAWSGKGIGPGGRINASLVPDPAGGRLVLAMGHDDTSVGHRNDVWLFDLTTQGWISAHPGDTGTGSGCTAFCECPPDFVEVDVGAPERRQYQGMTVLEGQGKALLFGGKSDCGYLDDTWTLDLSTFTWTEVDEASQGEACKRTGQQGCTDLCF